MSVKYFLIVRNPSKENLRILEFDCWEDQENHRSELKKNGHQGELVRAHATSLQELLATYTEYRPKNWNELLTKKV